jgi:putative transposase
VRIPILSAKIAGRKKQRNPHMNMIPESLWKEMEKVIPVKTSKVGRPEMDPRKALNGILFVLKTGIQWHRLPREMGAASTIHGKFRIWTKLGVFEQLSKFAANLYEEKKGKAGIWYATDTCSCKAPLANWGGKNPTDRGKIGAKKSIIVDQRGAILAIKVGPANRHDSQFFDQTLSRLQYNADELKIIAADSAYDSKNIRENAKKNKFILLASTNPRRRKMNLYHPSHRWIVERSNSWLNSFRSLKICWCKTASSFQALCDLACSYRLFKTAGIFV